MKTLLAAILITSFSVFAVFAQNGKAEQEILKIHTGFDEAFLKGDVAYFERYFAPEYTYSNNFGVLFNRVENLEFYRSFTARPPFRVVASKSDNVKIKVNGNAALLTADWTTTVQSLGDPTSECLTRIPGASQSFSSCAEGIGSSSPNTARKKITTRS